ncbi:hypothetical protein ES319_A10G185900v1 [Gossypium barbadense]|uniref:Uncharacterized protein n=1 Tax=Gossypium barbadense TaxID=3634 RepID=A0A5J5U5N1_GOSBA|nr:hypothetical protein ES319_A10G185900v1 [Gossypium barbadense]
MNIQPLCRLLGPLDTDYVCRRGGRPIQTEAMVQKLAMLVQAVSGEPTFGRWTCRRSKWEGKWLGPLLGFD